MTHSMRLDLVAKRAGSVRPRPDKFPVQELGRVPAPSVGAACVNKRIDRTDGVG